MFVGRKRGEMANDSKLMQLGIFCASAVLFAGTLLVPQAGANAYPGPNVGPNNPVLDGQIQINNQPTSGPDSTPMAVGQTTDSASMCGFWIHSFHPSAPTTATAYIQTSPDVYKFAANLPVDNNGCVAFNIFIANTSSGSLAGTVSSTVYASVSGEPLVAMLRGKSKIKITGIQPTDLSSGSGPGIPASAIFTFDVQAVAPDAPSAPSASAEYLSSTISWVAPLNSVGFPMSYTVTSSPGGLTCKTQLTTCFIAGLKSSLLYTFTVRASNAVGTGNSSLASNTVRTLSTPGRPAPPTNVVATGRYESVILTWVAGNSNGALITSYIAFASPGGRSCTVTVTSCTFNDLNAETAYRFVVVAVNIVGSSNQSEASNTVTPGLSVPLPPTNVTASAQESQAVVSWLAPPDTGGSDITQYTVSDAQGDTCTTSDGAAMTCIVEGLTDGQSYSFVVVATNAQGDSDFSGLSNAVVPHPTAPHSSTDVTATAVVGVANSQKPLVNVSWNLSPYDPGSPETKAVVTSKPGGRQCVDSTGAGSCIVSGLQVGTRYTFTVTNYNSVGFSAASAESNAVVAITVPGAPVSVGVTPQYQQSTVTWLAPTSNGGATISQYVITASDTTTPTNGGQTCTWRTGPLACTVTGLTDGDGYLFTVVASNAGGNSLPSMTKVSIRPARTTPGAPTITSVTATSNRIVVEFQPPAYDGGFAVTKYVVSLKPGGLTCENLETYKCTFDGLTNGTSYAISAVAVNQLGASQIGGWAAPAIPSGPPPTPQSPMATQNGNALSVVTWLAPTSNGGATISQYVITASDTTTPTNGGQTCTWRTGPLACTVTGLTNGDSYTFAVVAMNQSGESLPVSTSAVTPSRAPDAPVNVSASIESNGIADVAWTAGANNGGAVVTSYLVTMSPSGRTCLWVNGPLTCQIQMIIGKPVTFSVVALNVNGPGSSSLPSDLVSYASRPDAPQQVVGVTSGSGNILVSWLAPNFDGGSAITSYVVTSSPDSQGCTTPNGADLSCVVSGLGVGTTYIFFVTAVNNVGLGSISGGSRPVTSVGVPNAPSQVVATSYQSGSSQVSWQAPLVVDGDGIKSYVVTSNPDGRTCQWSFGPLVCRVVGLTNGVAYTFTVQAQNTQGLSNPSAASDPITPASTTSVPQNVTVTAGASGELVVSWLAPSDNGGSEPVGYVATASPGGRSCQTSGALTCTLTGLVNGINYSFRVSALNAAGVSGSSLPSYPAAASTAPSAPARPLASIAGAGQMKVVFSAALDNGGSAITSYTVRAFEVTGSVGSEVIVTTDASCTTANVSDRQCTVTGLVDGQVYVFAVAASNANGLSALSAFSEPVALITPPAAPKIVTVLAGNTTMTITWAAPSDNGSSPITYYVVTLSPSGFNCETTGALSCSIFGLTNGTTYSISMVALNQNGASPVEKYDGGVSPTDVQPHARLYAPAPHVRTILKVPGSPVISQIVVNDGTISIAWTDVVSGGSPITGYTVALSNSGGLCSVAATTHLCTFSGLTNMTSYVASLVAKNIVGSSSPTTSPVIIPMPLPAVPTGVLVQTTPQITYTSTGSVIVSWNAAMGATSYVVTSSPGGKTCTSIAVLTCTVTNLTQGVAYGFVVAAKNAAGTTSAALSSLIFPTSVPSAPTLVTGTIANQSSVVSWKAPSSNGGAPITSYVVTAAPGGQSCTVSGATSCTVSNLTNGTTYKFSVVAVNNVGPSAISAPSSSTKPAKAVPNSPTGVLASFTGEGSLTVTWSAPANDGGFAITGYTVTSSDGRTWCTLTTLTTCSVTRLVLGVNYSFIVKAKNSLGFSAPSLASAVVSQFDAPYPAFNVTATGAQNHSALVKWSAPLNLGGGRVTYQVVASDISAGHESNGGQICSWASGPLQCLVTGLTNGDSYIFSVQTTNPGGSSYSNPSTIAAIPSAVTSPPLNVTAAVIATNAATAAGRVTLSWTAPEQTNGSAISSYAVTSTPAGAGCTPSPATATECTVSNLVNGKNYVFNVVAINRSGSSSAGTSNAVTPITQAASPTKISAVSGNTLAVVSWKSPMNSGGSAVTSYTVTSIPGNLTCTTSTTSCSVTNLDNGLTYRFTVVALNNAGTSAVSSMSNYVTPGFAIPFAPTQLRAKEYPDGSVQLSWNIPTNDGGDGPLTSGGGAGPVTYYVTTGTSRQTCINQLPWCVITGLTVGQSYTFRVVAKNPIGFSPPSDASNTIVEVHTPGSPTGVTATVIAAGTAKISWKAPSYVATGITSYLVSSSSGGGSCTTSGALTCVISSLPLGASYTFTVTALAGVLSSIPSTPSSAVSLIAPPLEPRSVNVFVPLGTSSTGTSSASLTWSAPQNVAIAPVATYIVTSSPGNFTCRTAILACTVTGLTYGTTYSFNVVAVNAMGSSLVVSSNTVTPITIPGTVVSVTSVPAYQSVQVSWNAPISTGGAVISKYVVSGGGSLCVWFVGPLQCTVKNLPNGIPVTFSVEAYNAAGSSKPVSTVATPHVPVPTVPYNVVAIGLVSTTSAAIGSVTVAWNEAAQPQDAPVTGYTVVSSPSGAGCTTTGELSCTISVGLGVRYTFRVSATNIAGTSALSTASNSSISVAAPAAPVLTRATGGLGSLTVSWAAPTQTGGTPITSYVVRLSNDGGTWTWSSGALSHVFTGLLSGTLYSVTVTAINAAGISDDSNQLSASTLPV